MGWEDKKQQIDTDKMSARRIGDFRRLLYRLGQLPRWYRRFIRIEQYKVCAAPKDLSNPKITLMWVSWGQLCSTSFLELCSKQWLSM